MGDVIDRCIIDIEKFQYSPMASLVMILIIGILSCSLVLFEVWVSLFNYNDHMTSCTASLHP